MRKQQSGSGRNVRIQQSGSGRNVRTQQSGSGRNVRTQLSGSGRNVRTQLSGSGVECCQFYSTVFRTVLYGILYCTVLYGILYCAILYSNICLTTHRVGQRLSNVNCVLSYFAVPSLALEIVESFE